MPLPPFRSVDEALQYFFSCLPGVHVHPTISSDTTDRWMRAYHDMLSGHGKDPKEVLKLFEYSSGGMVISKGIRFTSVCEHHLLPFFGTASIGYLAKKVVGLSKLSRLVEILSKRLQLQERLTDQISQTLMDNLELEADGVGVILRAQHTCQTCRGVEQADAVMVTSSMLGFFREKEAVRLEFLALEKD